MGIDNFGKRKELFIESLDYSSYRNKSNESDWLEPYLPKHPGFCQWNCPFNKRSNKWWKFSSYQTKEECLLGAWRLHRVPLPDCCCSKKYWHDRWGKFCSHHESTKITLFMYVLCILVFWNHHSESVDTMTSENDLFLLRICVLRSLLTIK